jgi:hypothetical protein
LEKPAGDITKREAAEYTDRLILYRSDIKTIEDLKWFPRISQVVV